MSRRREMFTFLLLFFMLLFNPQLCTHFARFHLLVSPLSLSSGACFLFFENHKNVFTVVETRWWASKRESKSCEYKWRKLTADGVKRGEEGNEMWRMSMEKCKFLYENVMREFHHFPPPFFRRWLTRADFVYIASITLARAHIDMRANWDGLFSSSFLLKQHWKICHKNVTYLFFRERWKRRKKCLSTKWRCRSCVRECARTLSMRWCKFSSCRERSTLDMLGWCRCYAQTQKEKFM